MKYRFLSILMLIILTAAQSAKAVLTEQDLDATIVVLYDEILRARQSEKRISEMYDNMTAAQHEKLLGLMKESEKLALTLYSQKDDYVFDMAYACHEVNHLYKDFSSRKVPYDEIIAKLESEIARYTYLVESLSMLPPMMKGMNYDSLRRAKAVEDSLFRAEKAAKTRVNIERYGMVTEDDTTSAGVSITIMGRTIGDSTATSVAQQKLDSTRAVRDSLLMEKARLYSGVDEDSASRAIRAEMIQNMKQNMAMWRTMCISDSIVPLRDSAVAVAREILAGIVLRRDKVKRDAQSYEKISTRLEKLNEYANDKYAVLQNGIFGSSVGSYLQVIKMAPMYLMLASHDVKEKYRESNSVEGSDWRGWTIMSLVIGIIVAFALTVLAVRGALRVDAIASRLHKKAKMNAWSVAVGIATIIFVLVLLLARSGVSQNFYIMAAGRLVEFVLLVGAITWSILVRVDAGKVGRTIRSFGPLLSVGLVIILMRVMFMPSSLVTLVFPPVLVMFAVWSYLVTRKSHDLDEIDRMLVIVTLCVAVVSAAISWMGYILLSVEVIIWWLFQLTALQLIALVRFLTLRYEDRRVAPQFVEVSAKHPDYKKKLAEVKENLRESKGDYITHTWFYDLLMMTVIPVAGIISVVECIYLATDIFDLVQICRDILFVNFVDIEGVCQLSIFKIVMVAIAFFIFRYICYLIQSIYKEIKIDKTQPLHAQTNITLINNIIAIAVWGLYLIFSLVLLQVPKSGISIVSAGLATGIGFAMKDIINNLFYGISLMNGRIKVGDWVECDGVRGQVEEIGYESTQIQTSDGCVIEFLNSDLFAKNFKNLTKNHGYEKVKIPIGVAYGTNVEEVRKMIVERLTKRLIKELPEGEKMRIDRKKGIQVMFSGFGDSSVDLDVVLWPMVESKYIVSAIVREEIYCVLNEHSIEIPFPQRDIHIVSQPTSK